VGLRELPDELGPIHVDRTADGAGLGFTAAGTI
jgi:hypothetical protein